MFLLTIADWTAWKITNLIKNTFAGSDSAGDLDARYTTGEIEDSEEPPDYKPLLARVFTAGADMVGGAVDTVQETAAAATGAVRGVLDRLIILATILFIGWAGIRIFVK